MDEWKNSLNPSAAISLIPKQDEEVIQQEVTQEEEEYDDVEVDMIREEYKVEEEAHGDKEEAKDEPLEQELEMIKEKTTNTKQGAPWHGILLKFLQSQGFHQQMNQGHMSHHIKRKSKAKFHKTIIIYNVVIQRK
eukprot:Gb_21155 [translate_table: standard]